MKRILATTRDAETRLEMTPMIDVIFLLIIFFMLVTQLSRLENEQLRLPVVKKTDPEVVESTQVVINVIVKDAAGNPEIRIGGVAFGTDALTDYLQLEAEIWGHWIPNPHDPEQRDSTLEVLIRGDRHAHSGAVHDIYRACQAAHVFRVRLAALSERNERED